MLSHCVCGYFYSHAFTLVLCKGSWCVGLFQTGKAAGMPPPPPGCHLSAPFLAPLPVCVAKVRMPFCLKASCSFLQPGSSSEEEVPALPVGRRANR